MRVRLIHWNATEGAEKAQLLRGAGYQAEMQPLKSPADLRELRDDPPDVVVIDLSRVPSHGREIGSAIRRQKGTRHLPLVFLDGEPAKVARTRDLLPDATYGQWADFDDLLRKALENPPTAQPVVRGAMDAYSGTPLDRKLGIKPGFIVTLLGAPAGFRDTLPTLPPNVAFQEEPTAGENLIIWFVNSEEELQRNIGRVAAITPPGGLWIAWRKKASGIRSDVSERSVRQAGLATGLVDYKIAAIDRTWSGLKFTRKQTNRTR